VRPSPGRRHPFGRPGRGRIQRDALPRLEISGFILTVVMSLARVTARTPFSSWVYGTSTGACQLTGASIRKVANDFSRSENSLRQKARLEMSMSGRVIRRAFGGGNAGTAPAARARYSALQFVSISPLKSRAAHIGGDSKTQRNSAGLQDCIKTYLRHAT